MTTTNRQSVAAENGMISKGKRNSCNDIALYSRRNKGTIGIYINMGEWTLLSERRKWKEYIQIKIGLGVFGGYGHNWPPHKEIQGGDYCESQDNGYFRRKIWPVTGKGLGISRIIAMQCPNSWPGQGLHMCSLLSYLLECVLVFYVLVWKGTFSYTNTNFQNDKKTMWLGIWEKLNMYILMF